MPERIPFFEERSEARVPIGPRLLDVVALLSDAPAHGLRRGQVGTIVEVLDGAYEVEFLDDDGRTYAELALEPDRFLVLRYRLQ